MYSAELGAGGDGVVDHDEVQRLLALFLVHGGDEHAVGLKAHHLARRQVDYGHEGLADEVLRLVPLVDAGEYLAVDARAVVEDEASEACRSSSRPRSS